MRWDPTQPIAARLRQDDEVVWVRRSLDVSTPDRPLTWTEVIEYAARRADAVITLRVDKVVPVLAEQDTWIDTQLSGTVIQAIASSPRVPVKRGGRLSANISDGEMVIYAHADEQPGQARNPLEAHTYTEIVDVVLAMGKR